MDLLLRTDQRRSSRSEWRFAEKSLVVITYIFLLILQNNCQTVLSKETSHIENITKRIDSLDNNVESKQCHSCQSSSKFDSNDKEVSNDESENFIDEVISVVGTFTQKYLLVNKTEIQLEKEVERIIDNALSKDRFEIMEGVEIKTVENGNSRNLKSEDEDAESRALFSTYTYEYRLLQKIKNFVETHIISINLPKAARFITFRSFGLKKLFVPLILGAQLVKGMIVAMFLPSILGSFGKIVGKAISQLSASSSQASNPPAMDDQGQYSDQKDFVGYETDPTGAYAYPQDGLYANMETGDVNGLSNVDMSRFGASGQKVSYLPSKTGYYKNQLTSASNSYKVFQKIPASSMILSNYDPFYSPLLSRLDGIFARLGLTPSENAIDTGTQIGGQSLSDVKLESCREQLICLMYANPAKYAPYSNLVSAQLSRPGWSQNPFWEDEVLHEFSSTTAARSPAREPSQSILPQQPSTSNSSKKVTEKKTAAVIEYPKKRAAGGGRKKAPSTKSKEPEPLLSCSDCEDEVIPATQPTIRRKRTAQLLDSEEEAEPATVIKAARAETLRSFLTQRGASGYTTQRDPVKTGEYFIELRVYNSREAERLPSIDRWKNALTTLKIAADSDTAVFRAVSKLVQAGKEDFKHIQPIMYPK